MDYNQHMKNKIKTIVKKLALFTFLAMLTYFGQSILLRGADAVAHPTNDAMALNALNGDQIDFQQQQATKGGLRNSRNLVTVGFPFLYSIIAVSALFSIYPEFKGLKEAEEN